MAQVIDALLITFGIDTREFDKARQKIDDGTKNLRETSKKNADYMESQGKRAAGFFSSIKNEMLALAGVSLTFGGTLGFVKGMTGDLQALANQSQVLGLSAKQLDGWARAAEAAGSSAEKITGTLGDLNTKLMLFRQGKADPALMGALQMLSQDTGAVFNPLQSDAQGILKQALQAAKKDKNQERARVALRQMGLDDATINSALNGQLLPNVERFTTGSGINDANLKAAKEFNEQWTVLAQNFEAFKNQLYSGLIPYVKQFSNYLNDISEWMRSHPKEIKDGFDAIFSSVKSFASIANDAAKQVGGWTTALEILIGLKVASWVLGVTKSFSALFALVPPPWLIAAAAVGTGAKAISNISEEAKNADHTNSLWESIKQRWNAGGWYNNKAVNEGKNPEDRRRDQDEKAYWETTKQYLGKIADFFVSPAGAAELSPNLQGYQPNVPLNATAARLGPKGKALLNAMSGEFGMLEGKYGLPAGLLRGVAATESGGDPYAVSKAGAKGLFQFMPGTAKDMGLNGSDVYDPKKSAEAAAKYLHYLIMATGDTQSALQAYNWGLGNLQKKGMQNAPKETQEYYAKVVANMRAGAGMAADSVAPYRMPSQGGQSFHIQQMQVVTPASSVGKLSQDMSKSAQNRATLIGYDSGQSGG
ncbi:lytic transglycosylase domain-containing protein [Klebsiella variicola]|nr:transglycosylase SLT domain-containing protein [Klebsiella variicola]